MTKILNLARPPRLFVKGLLPSAYPGHLRWRIDPRVLLNYIWKLTNGVKVNCYLILAFISILTSQTWIFKMLLNYCTETEVEKLTEEIIEVGPGIWRTCSNSYISASLYVRLQSQKGIFLYSVHCNGKRGCSLCRMGI